MSKRFFVLGSGNVASHLVPAIVGAGWSCAGVYSRTMAHASSLAQRVHAEPWDDLRAVLDAVRADEDLDILLISLTDNALSSVADLLSGDINATVLHTSGSTPLSVLSKASSYGVLYPMQTFSKERAVDIPSTPFFIESHDERAKARILEIATDLGLKSVREITSSERVRLHMSAVFGCNFVNHLYAMAAEVLKETGIPFHVLAPLLEETMHKALTHDPVTVQTGPAVRHDQVTIERHISALSDDKHLRDVYEFLTQSIQSFQNPDKVK